MSRIAGLYAIADSGWNPCATLPDLVLKFLDGGCRLVQLRMKSAAAAHMRKTAEEIALLKERREFTFIVNDHADIALEVGADGVHVGEHDTPVADIKRRFGSKLIVGYSSHSIEEAWRAVDAGADYVAFGAIFPTRTKGPGHPVQGLSRLKELTDSVDVPVVAIGGIGRDNVLDVLKAGADSVAMITALSKAPDIAAETRWFVEAIER
ncbi:MAG: thiamine phosphate synthase [Pseudomonadota bacterium]